MGEGDPGRARAAGVLRRRARAHQGARQRCCWSTRSRPACARTACCRSSTTRASRSLEAPDMETYSKALNAGQYPLSVLAVTERAAGLYRKGIYGNTMTTNPRALDVACAVLGAAHAGTARQHPRARRARSLDKLEKLQGRTRRPDHQGPGHRPAVLVRARAAVQVLRRRLDRGMAARARHRRDPRRRQLAALHPALRHQRRGSRPGGRARAPGAAARARARRRPKPPDRAGCLRMDAQPPLPRSRRQARARACRATSGSSASSACAWTPPRR